MKNIGLEDKYGASAKLQQHMVQCMNINCHQFAHHMPTRNNRKIFTLPQTKGKYFSCFEILLSDKSRLYFSKVPANTAYNDAVPGKFGCQEENYLYDKLFSFNLLCFEKCIWIGCI